MVARLLAIYRIFWFVLIVAFSGPFQWTLMRLGIPYAKKYPHVFHRLCLWAMNFKITVHGEISDKAPTLFVSNHSSYLDIMVLGGSLPASFVSKAEVGKWPVVGFLSRLQRTVYIDRLPRNAKEHAGQIQTRLEEGGNLILFPEGTSNDGNRTYKFKSALFKVAEIEVNGEALTVQPVSIGYARLDGMPIGYHLRPFFGWYGDMEMAPHLFELLALGSAEVDIVMHEPVTITDFGTRKALADHCHKMVADGVSESITGRLSTVKATGANAALKIAV